MKQTELTRSIPEQAENIQEIAQNSTLKLVDLAPQPAFVLNLDPRLSLYHANQSFYQLLGTHSREFPELYENKFCNILSFHHQFRQLRNLGEALKHSPNYQSDVEVITATGQVKRLNFQVHRQTLGTLGEKLVGLLLPAQEAEPCLSPS